MGDGDGWLECGVGHVKFSGFFIHVALSKPRLIAMIWLDEVEKHVDQRAKDAALKPARLLLTPS